MARHLAPTQNEVRIVKYLNSVRCNFEESQNKIAEQIISILSVGASEEKLAADNLVITNLLSEYFVEMIVPLMMEIKQLQRERERKSLSDLTTKLSLFNDRYHKTAKYRLSKNDKLLEIVRLIKRLLDYDNTKSFYEELLTNLGNDETSIFNFLGIELDPLQREKKGRMAESLFEYLKYNRFITLINGGRMITSKKSFQFIFENQDQLDNNIIIMIDLNVIALHLFYSLVDNIYDACSLLICIMTQSLNSYKALNLFDYEVTDSNVDQSPYFSVNIEGLRLMSMFNEAFLRTGKFKINDSPKIIDNKVVQQIQRIIIKSKNQNTRQTETNPNNDRAPTPNTATSNATIPNAATPNPDIPDAAIPNAAITIESGNSGNANKESIAGIKSLRKKAQGSSKEGRRIKKKKSSIKAVKSKSKRKRKSATSTASTSSPITAKILRSMKLKTHKSSNQVKSQKGSRIKKIRKKVQNPER